MANRPIYIVSGNAPYYKRADVEFEWYPGFSKAQKQRSIKSLHESFNRIYPMVQILEVSSKSYQGGEIYSAFNLNKYVPSLNKNIPVENIFQSSKVFENGGPYLDLLMVSPKQAKTDPRIHSSRLVKFNFENKDYPLIPRTIFYDYIYMNALLENKDIIDNLVKYDAFTDIEFNPNKSINCQAIAACKYVSLYRLGIIDRIKDFNSFIKLFI